MDTLQVVRIENGDGIGIFRSDFEWNYLNDNVKMYSINNVFKRHDNFLTPEEDGLNMQEDWKCAYKSMEQMLEWINLDELKVLISCGNYVMLFEVKQYQVGSHQVIFQEDSVIKKEDITSLFN